MEKRKSISLNRYIISLLIKITLGIMIILFVSITIMFIMLSTNVLNPANTGEIEAATDIKDIKEQHTLPPNFNPQFYEYIHFNKNKTVLDSSLGKRQMEHVLKKYNDNQKSYQNGMFLPLKNEEVILITWGYKTQLTNPILRTIIPHPGLVMLFGTLLVFLVLFIHYSNKKIQQQVALIKIASQDLATPISTETRIKEFNTSLHAMEDLRQSLKSSLSKEWNTQEQRKKDIASLSHDIKTPLTAILGNTELLLEDDITLEQQDLLIGIYHAAIRTKSYVDVLQKTNQEEDFNQEKTDVTLQQIVEDVNQSLSPLVYSKEITLNYNYHPQKTVRCFDSLLTRVLINIGENAIRHTSLGMVSFTITQDNNQTTFTVAL